MQLSIVIPVRNEAEILAAQLQSLQAIRREGHQLIVVDGDSSDGSRELAAPLCDRLLHSAPGRARQMNQGAAVAQGDLLLFLHVDTGLPADSIRELEAVLLNPHFVWGRFNVRLSGRHWLYRIIEKAMNWRSRLTAVTTGDQGIFVRRTVFEQIGGFAPIELMEDVELSKRLRRIARPQCLDAPVQVSTRRWQQQGIFKTMFLMWWLRLLFVCGVKPDKLLQIYSKDR